MSERNPKPVIFLAFANDRQAYLNNLKVERRKIFEALKKAGNLCQVIERTETTIKDILDVFQDYSDRIAIFHYGGHADDYLLLLESEKGERAIAHSGGLVSFLGRQKGLQLVFINGCSSKQQAQDLQKAGVPGVIGTSQPIDDEIATDISERFYKGIAAGLTIERAWEESTDQVKIQKGNAGFRAIGTTLKNAGETIGEITFPWEIYYNDGKKETCQNWNLPEAVSEPLFGLPDIPQSYTIPKSPFLLLKRYEKEHAKIFFGRSFDIRTLYDRVRNPKAPPTILLYGQSGVGKSSLLDAGLKPRLEADYTVIYQRRVQHLGLAGTLHMALNKALAEAGPSNPPQNAPVPHAPPVPEKANQSSESHKELEQLAVFANAITVDTIKHEVSTLIDRLKNVLAEDAPGSNPRRSARDNSISPEHNTAAGPVNGEALSLWEKWQLLETVRDARGTFQMSEFSFSQLKSEGVPEEILTKLTRLIHQPVQGKTQFLEILKDVIGETALRKFETPLLKHAGKPLIFILDQVEEMYTQPPESYEFNEKSFENLKTAGIPSEILNKLLSLKDQRIEGKSNCLNRLKEVIGEESVTRYKVKLLRHTGLYNELEIFLDALQSVFNVPEHCPKGKLVLGYRKEYHPEIEKGFIGHGLRHSKIFLDHLGRRDILDIFHGLTRTQELSDYYKLGLEENLPEIIADDLLEDKDSSVAPVLQIVLANLWKIEKEKKKNNAPFFTIDYYQELKKKGIAMREFFDQQVELLKDVQPGAVNSGLALDVLQFHTTEMGTARTCEREDLENRYIHAIPNQKNQLGEDDILELLKNLQQFSLMTRHSETTFSLAHDTLAPVVTREYNQSDLPGQRAARILKNKMKDFRQKEKGVWLDAIDLKVVENGLSGMRLLTWQEEKLLEISRQKRKVNRMLSYGALGLIIVFAVIAGLMWHISGQNYLKARANNLAFIAYDMQFIDNTQAIRIAQEAYQIGEENSTPVVQQIISDVFHSQEQTLFYNASLPHDKKVTSANISLDGRRMLTTAEDKFVRIWDMNGVCLDTLEHPLEVYQAVYSRDGSILTHAADSTVRVWYQNGFRKDLKPAAGIDIKKAVFSHGGNSLAITSDSAAILWDKDGNLLNTLKHDAIVTQAAFAYDNKFLTVTADSTVYSWSENGQPLDTLKYQHRIEKTVFSPNGRYLIVLSNNTAILKDAGLGIIDTLRHRARIKSATFSREGKIITTSQDPIARIWNTAGKQIDSLKHESDLNFAVFSPDGEQVLTVFSDSIGQVWDKNGRPIGRLKHEKEILSAVFSADGRQVLTASEDKTAKLWDKSERTANKIVLHSGGISSAKFSKDGKNILTASFDKTVKLWDQHGNLLKSFTHDRVVNSAVFSPDEMSILSASRDKTARLWRVADGEEIARLPHDRRVESAAFSPNGANILTVSGNAATLWWANNNISHIRQYSHYGRIRSAEFSPGGGWLLTAARDSTVILWSLAGAPIDTFRHQSQVYTAVFSPADSTRILSTSDSSAYLWEVNKAASLLSFKHEDEKVQLAVFSADGEQVLTAGSGGTVILWEKSGKKIALVKHEKTINSIAFSPSGDHFLTASSDKSAKLWMEGNLLASYDAHVDVVTKAVFSNDGKYILTASNDKNVRLWLTPDAIYEKMSRSNIYRLNTEDKILAGMND